MVSFELQRRLASEDITVHAVNPGASPRRCAASARRERERDADVGSRVRCGRSWAVQQGPSTATSGEISRARSSSSLSSSVSSSYALARGRPRPSPPPLTPRWDHDDTAHRTTARSSTRRHAVCYSSCRRVLLLVVSICVCSRELLRRNAVHHSLRGSHSLATSARAI